MPSRSEIYLDRLWKVFHFNPIGSHNGGLDVSSAVTIAKPVGAEKIMLQSLSQNVRFTLDGTTPTAALGFQLRADDPPAIVLIEDNATLNVIEEAVTADFQYQWGI